MKCFSKARSPATLSLLALALALNACSAGGGPMGGKIATRTVGGAAAEDEDVQDAKPSSPGKVASGDSTSDKGDPADPLVEDTQLPKPTGPMPEKIADEIVLPPAEITGAFLTCYRDRIENTKAYVYCATADTMTKKIFEPNERFTGYTFNYVSVNGLNVSQKDLPLVHRYNVEFTISAASNDLLVSNVAAIKYTFAGRDFDNKDIKLEQRVTTSVRPELWVQSQKPQNNAGFRCLDRDRMKAAQPFQVVTTPCGSNSIKHDWYVNADKKIAHVNGECLAFDPTDGLTVVKPCDSAESPKFDFNGEQIKIQNSNNCLGLIRPDNSGVDYSASVACNTGDVTQRWKISPQASP